MKFRELLQLAGMNEENPIEGISDLEIRELTVAQGQVQLPAIYCEFLRECGRSAGLFQRDADFFFPGIKSLKKELFEMLEDEGLDFALPENAFVFGAYQGFQFHYFICDEVADPVIYQVDDGEENPTIVGNSFSEYISRGVEQYRKAFYGGK